MKIDVRAKRIRLDRDLKEQMYRRLDFALSRFESRLESVRVVISDLNGPKGGLDKHCRIEIHARGGWSVHVEETDSRLPAAIDRLADRAGRVVSRALDRRLERSPDRTGAGAVPRDRRVPR